MFYSYFVFKTLRFFGAKFFRVMRRPAQDGSLSNKLHVWESQILEWVVEWSGRLDFDTNGGFRPLEPVVLKQKDNVLNRQKDTI